MRILTPIVLFIALTTALPTASEKSGQTSNTEVEAPENHQEASTTNPTVAGPSTKDAEPAHELGPQCILEKPEESASGLRARAPISDVFLRLVVPAYKAFHVGVGMYWIQKLQDYNKKKGNLQAIQEKGSNEVTAKIALGKNEDPNKTLASISEYLSIPCTWQKAKSPKISR